MSTPADFALAWTGLWNGDLDRAERAGLLFALDGAPIADGSGFAIRWSAERTGVSVSGIDVFRLAGDRIAEVWSLTGGRRFPS